MLCWMQVWGWGSESWPRARCDPCRHKSKEKLFLRIGETRLLNPLDTRGLIQPRTYSDCQRNTRFSFCDKPVSHSQEKRNKTGQVQKLGQYWMFQSAAARVEFSRTKTGDCILSCVGWAERVDVEVEAVGRCVQQLVQLVVQVQ